MESDRPIINHVYEGRGIKWCFANRNPFLANYASKLKLDVAQ
jgi:hypothetical protein